MCSVYTERDVSFGRDVHFVRDVCLRQVNRNASHHCDQWEHHHYAARHIITCAGSANITFHSGTRPIFLLYCFFAICVINWFKQSEPSVFRRVPSAAHYKCNLKWCTVGNVPVCRSVKILRTACAEQRIGCSAHDRILEETK